MFSHLLGRHQEPPSQTSKQTKFDITGFISTHFNIICIVVCFSIFSNTSRLIAVLTSESVSVGLVPESPKPKINYFIFT